MPHPLVLALFDNADLAAAAARRIRALGLAAEDLSIVARSHEEEGQLAREMGGTPGVEIEDSRAAARVGEAGARVLASLAVVLPGIGPILAAGPLAAELGEAAGHVLGGLPGILGRAGVAEDVANRWRDAIENGAVLIGAHVRDGSAERVREVLAAGHARELTVASWP